MRLGMLAALSLVVAACTDRAVPKEQPQAPRAPTSSRPLINCPPGTTFVAHPNVETPRNAHCELPDGSWHGPWLSIADGHPFAQGTYVQGKQEGLSFAWADYAAKRKMWEEYYSSGVKTRSVMFESDGTVAMDCIIRNMKRHRCVDGKGKLLRAGRDYAR